SLNDMIIEGIFVSTKLRAPNNDESLIYERTYGIIVD
ncbi:MAG: hypothetical protein ACI84K_000001, partial [Pseudohongiellaceae bacterium]